MAWRDASTNQDHILKQWLSAIVMCSLTSWQRVLAAIHENNAVKSGGQCSCSSFNSIPALNRMWQQRNSHIALRFDYARTRICRAENLQECHQTAAWSMPTSWTRGITSARPHAHTTFEKMHLKSMCNTVKCGLMLIVCNTLRIKTSTSQTISIHLQCSNRARALFREAWSCTARGLLFRRSKHSNIVLI